MNGNRSPIHRMWCCGGNREMMSDEHELVLDTALDSVGAQE